MLINLTDYFEVRGKEARIEVPYEAKVVKSDFSEFPVLHSEPAIFEFSNIGDGKLQLMGNAAFKLAGVCDRCLTDVEIEVPLSFEYTFAKPDGYHEIDDEQEVYMKGYELDAEALITNELLMSLPMKVLCKDTCKGLCPVCGVNRNVTECGCDTFVPDPRMAAIKDIFNANKEV